jgi:hypothetical protein
METKMTILSQSTPTYLGRKMNSIRPEGGGGAEAGSCDKTLLRNLKSPTFIHKLVRLRKT